MRLAETIIGLLPLHTCYVEVCGGSGAVLFSKPRSEVEIYNDINNHLVTMFQVIRNEPQDLMDRLAWVTYSRKEWNDALVKLRANVFVDRVDHAINTIIVYAQSMSGAVTMKRGGWGYSKANNAAHDFFSRLDGIKAVSERLKNVQIENLDFRELIPKYDSKDTIFYVDPPYITSTRAASTAYVDEFSDADHNDLLDILMRIDGQFILSGYDHTAYDRLNVFDRIDIPTISKARSDGILVNRTEVLWYKSNARQLNFSLT